jgi:hypothetical protein
VATAVQRVRRLPLRYVLLVGLCVLAGCGATRRSQPRPRADPTLRANRPVQPDLSFLSQGSRTMSRLVAGIGARTRECPDLRIPPLNGGAPMEIDIFGRTPPACSAALAQLRRARRSLGQNVGGTVTGWRCVWTSLPAVGCRRAGSVLAASDPGG